MTTNPAHVVPLTTEEIELIQRRINDIDWDISDRYDVWILLPKLLSESSAAVALRAERDALQAELADVVEEMEDSDNTAGENYDAIWKTIYPNDDAKSWEYPSQVVRHVKDELSDLRAQLAAVTAERDAFLNSLALRDQDVAKLESELAALRSAPAQGWRLLDAVETIQEGDEWWDDEREKWVIVSNMFFGEPSFDDSPIRRRLPVTSTSERADALVDAAEQIKRNAREIPLGEVFDTGPLEGVSMFNAYMFAAKLLSALPASGPREMGE